jgi:hypothetical protein
LSYKFEADNVNVSIDNKSANELTFQIALAPGVKVNDGQPSKLQRGAASLGIVGFEKLERPATGPALLEVNVPAGANRTIVLRPEKS